MNELTENQKAAVAACDATLKANGLVTYSEMEEQLAMALTACMNAVDLGKEVTKRLGVAEQEIKRMKPESFVTKETLPEFKELHAAAIKDGKSSFIFHGTEVLCDYARYVEQYWRDL